MSTPHQRLDEHISRGRLARRLSWKELAEVTGISYAALRAIRRGRYRPSDLTKRRLEDALRWQAGSVEQILAGGEPTEAAADEPAGYGEWEPWAREMWDVAKAHGFTDDEAWEAIESVHIRRELRRRRPSA